MSDDRACEAQGAVVAAFVADIASIARVFAWTRAGGVESVHEANQRDSRDSDEEPPCEVHSCAAAELHEKEWAVAPALCVGGGIGLGVGTAVLWVADESRGH